MFGLTPDESSINLHRLTIDISDGYVVLLLSRFLRERSVWS
jgi:hypothetical protein